MAGPCLRPELRPEVESLLAASEDQTDFIEEAAFLHHRAADPDTETVSSAGDPLIGARMGAYEIVSRIGEGGMGSVYRAFAATHNIRRR